MSRFLVTYHGAGGVPQDAEARAQANAAFGKWAAEAGSALIDPGAPVAVVAVISQGSAPERVDVKGYSLLEAPTADDVRRILQSHPFVARGGTLQVHEVLAV